MKELLYADPEKIFEVQGRARALHEILQKFPQAYKEMESLDKGNTNGAP